MDEIKFRIWNGKEMLYITNGGEYQLTFGMNHNWSLWDVYEEICNSDDDIGNVIMQYTGVKDSNGISIYDGDIISHPAYDFGYQVVFIDGAYYLKVDYTKYQLSKIWDGYIVIGNIFENPNMLEPKGKNRMIDDLDYNKKGK